MSAWNGRPSAVLIVNPNAGSLPDAVRREVIAAMRASFRLESVHTHLRDAGIGLAREAAQAGARLVVAFGGDGLVNEVANGVAGTEAALGIIPGGTMNVFSRALGIPQNAFAAIRHLKESLTRPPRTVPLGRMNDRLFTVSAGCGFDAEAAERVERYLSSKRRFGQLFFYWSAARVLGRSVGLRCPNMTVRGPFGEADVAMTIACNAGPYAYFAGRPVELAPDVELEGGIDVFAMKRMRVEALPVYVWRVAVSGDLVHHPDVLYATHLAEFEVSAGRAFHRHVDGEPLPLAEHVRFDVVPSALNVRA
jgi:diacylglycerol kinase family enzyme